jgi:hypothetical protein
MAFTLSNRAVNMFHTLAETMYDMLSPEPSLHRTRRITSRMHPHYGMGMAGEFHDQGDNVEKKYY